MQLVAPSTKYFPSFKQSMLEWAGAHQDGSGIRDGDVLHDRDGFDQWVDQLLAEEATPAGPGFVTCTYCWMVEEDEFLGSIALRHELNDFLRTFGGHIGYGVRPSARGQGLAAQALGEVLSMARDRGIREVLLTCDAKNTASRRTIERNGGRYESDVEYEGDTVQRFWITTDHD